MFKKTKKFHLINKLNPSYLILLFEMYNKKTKSQVISKIISINKNFFYLNVDIFDFFNQEIMEKMNKFSK